MPVLNPATGQAIGQVIGLVIGQVARRAEGCGLGEAAAAAKTGFDT